jgi:hypothetical protein
LFFVVVVYRCRRVPRANSFAKPKLPDAFEFDLSNARIDAGNTLPATAGHFM